MKKIILLFLLLCSGLLNAQISLSEIQDTVSKGYVPITDYDPALATYIQKYMLLQDYLEDSISWASVPVGLHDAVTLAGSYDYITLSGQVITRNQIDLTTDVTGLLPYASLSGAPTLLSQFTDDLGHVEESTTVTDLANGLDISLSTYDITVSPDFVELTTETTIDGTDYVIIHDATTPNDGKITYANLLADIVSDASLDLYQVLTNGNDAGGLDAMNFAEVEAEEFIGDLRGAVLFKAQAGENLLKGEVVYVSGISGNTTIVSKADADDAAKMPAFGVVAVAANSGNPVDIYTFGTLSNLNTLAFSLGDILYVSTTAGQLTATPPTGESALIQNIAKVTRVDNSAGSIKISGAGRTNATPNLNTGRLFVGNASNQAVADGTMYVDIANSEVGIGTSSPNAVLHTVGASTSEAIFEATSGNPDIGFAEAGNLKAQIKYNVTSHGLGFFVEESNTGYGGISTEDMFIRDGGNVGIGLSNPLERFVVSGGNMQLQGSTYTDFTDYWGSNNNSAFFTPYGFLGSSGSFAVSLYSNGYRNDSAGFTYIGSNGNTSTASGIDLMPTGDIYFRNGTASGAALPIVMTIKNGGNVGIGTSSPLSIVDIHDNDAILNIRDNSDSSVKLRMRGNSANDLYDIRTEIAGGYTWNDRGVNLTTHYDDVDNYIWRSNGAVERMRLNSSGLDLTTVPDDATDNILTWGSTGLISKTTKASIIEDAGYWDRTGTTITQANSGDDLNFDSNTFFVDASTNRVGIGTNTPAYKMHISDAAPYFRITNTAAPLDEKSWNFNAGTDGKFRFSINTDAGASLNNWLEVNRVGNSVDLVSFPQGNVGIGTSNPTWKLDVSTGAGEGESYFGRTITTDGIRVLSTSGRTGYISEVANTYSTKGGEALYYAIFPFDSGHNGYAYRTSVGTTLTDTYWTDYDGNGYFAGNVGIGTTSPSKQLTIQSNGNAESLIETTIDALAATTFKNADAQWRIGVEPFDDGLIFRQIDAGYTVGEALKLAANLDVRVYNNLRVDAMTQDDAESQVVVWDSGTNNLRWRDVSTIEDGDGIYDGSGSLSSSTTVTINGYGIDFVGSTDEFSINSFGQTSWTEGSNSSSVFQSGTGFYIQNATSLGSIQLRTGTSPSTALYVRYDGNIGINTLNPSQKLEVAGNVFTSNNGTNNYFRAYHSDGAYTNYSGFGIDCDRSLMYLRPTTNGTKDLSIGSSTKYWDEIDLYYDNNISFFYNGNLLMNLIDDLSLFDSGSNEDIRLNPNGDSYIMNDFGIGIASPSAKLDVVGDTELNGDLLITDGTRIFKITQNVNGTQIGDVSGSGGNDLNLQSNSVTRINIEAEGRININDVLNLNPLSAAPNSGTEQDGDIYLHDTGSAYELRVWNGSSWQTL